MKRFYLTIILVFSLWCLPLRTPAQTSAILQPHAGTSDKSQADKSAQVDQAFSEWVRDNSPGAAVLVIKDGRVVHEKGYGLANLETKSPVKPDTLFLLGSLTKQFTAMAVMILAEQGLLKFGDPLSKFFPQFPKYAEAITVKHLLNHTSGLPDYEKLFVEKLIIDKDWPRSTKLPPSMVEPTAKDALALLAREPKLDFEPGTKFEYSNSGYVVLGQIIEKVSGRSFAKFLKRHIFDPLEMERSVVYDETRPVIPNRAASYTFKEGTYKEVDYTPLNMIYGEDNVYSNLRDLYRWDRALSTEKLVKQSTLKEAFTAGLLNSGKETGYGYGWFVGKTLGLNHVQHTGSWLGFLTSIKRYPEQGFTVIILSNKSNFPLSDATYRVSKVYIGNKMALPVVTSLSPDVMSRYVGGYKFETGSTWNITFEKGHLWLNNYRPTSVKILPRDEKNFFVEGREDIPVVFELNEKGDVTGLKLGTREPARKLS